MTRTQLWENKRKLIEQENEYIKSYSYQVWIDIKINQTQIKLLGGYKH